MYLLGFPDGSMVKNLPDNAEDTRRPSFHPSIRNIPCRRKWYPTPVSLPGKSHGQRSQVDYTSWGHTESDTTEQLCMLVRARARAHTHTHTHTHF